MSLKSLDPRINRMNLPDGELPPMEPKAAFDQFETFEVFARKRDKTPFTYAGPVHAPNADVAFLFAKEQYSRRSACSGLWVVLTRHIMVSPYANDDENIYDSFEVEIPEDTTWPLESYEVFHLKKRGKAHTHVGRIGATSYQEAYHKAKAAFAAEHPAVNMWVVKSKNVLQSAEEDRDMWLTLPEKKYREPAAYKVLDRIKKFKEEEEQKALTK
ncbi:phenylacetic acid degradation b [Pontibacter qinzhouensis]|uniref:Phenylacetic acid degradation b n=1 Tax=Pontibacter qinzhouensis TaxID=2603253 RepID=A0A5C8K6R2_9BACT|nr:phenylacetic acid degradation b [Pontibacter qinzhouensis]TXK44454.1 phenylacetic acid degradation b [Pontibacter qinzhouensis]